MLFVNKKQPKNNVGRCFIGIRRIVCLEFFNSEAGLQVGFNTFVYCIYRQADYIWCSEVWF